MLKILKYTLYDLSRSRWSYLYFSFFLLFTGAMVFLSGDTTRVVISLMNVILILCPLVAMMFTTMYSYNSREYIELLLAQPLRRSDIFIGQYLGIALSMSVAMVLGMIIPFLIFDIGSLRDFSGLLILAGIGVLLSFVFSGLAFLIALRFDNKIKGFGVALLTWLFFAVIYDGLVLLLLLFFRDYPLERLTIALSMLNPIDLSRILILLNLDISALMGYTGAVFERFFGTHFGMILSMIALGFWAVVPFWRFHRLALRKDF